MEVHHHRSHPGNKWSHYFREFLMLFLAVFCGFLAEYQLEHKIEREKGKQYIRLFYEDLKTDTSRFSELVNLYKIKLAALENRKDCYDSLDHDIKSDDCLSALAINSEYFPDFVYTDRTLQQLKNAGGLRLLKQADADSILAYDNLLRSYIKVETTSYQENQTEIRSVFYSLVNYKRLSRFEEKTSAPFLYSTNRDLLNRYFNLLELYTLSSQGNLEDILRIQAKAIDLIEYFKARYSFK